MAARSNEQSLARHHEELRRRRLVSEACPATPAGVIAILGLGFAVAGSAACGAATGLETDVEPATEEEACLRAVGAEWTSGDCGGGFDRCGRTFCEHVMGMGCSCPSPGRCWDGGDCVDDARGAD